MQTFISEGKVVTVSDLFDVPCIGDSESDDKTAFEFQRDRAGKLPGVYTVLSVELPNILKSDDDPNSPPRLVKADKIGSKDDSAVEAKVSGGEEQGETGSSGKDESGEKEACESRGREGKSVENIESGSEPGGRERVGRREKGGQRVGGREWGR